MSETENENPIICLNYCMTDPETGFCLTCGRPPIPVSEIGLKSGTFNGMSFTVALRSMQMTERVPDVASEAVEEDATSVPQKIVPAWKPMNTGVFKVPSGCRCHPVELDVQQQ